MELCCKWVYCVYPRTCALRGAKRENDHCMCSGSTDRDRGEPEPCEEWGSAQEATMAEVRQMPCPPGNTRMRDLPPALRLPRALSQRAVPIPLSGRKPAPSCGDHTTQSTAAHRDPPMHTHSDPLLVLRSTVTSAPRPGLSTTRWMSHCCESVRT